MAKRYAFKKENQRLEVKYASTPPTWFAALFLEMCSCYFYSANKIKMSESDRKYLSAPMRGLIDTFYERNNI